MQRPALTPSPSPKGRGENTNGSLPSPARGRGAGGEGKRLTNHEFIRQLRSQQTPAEERLWYHLRDRRLLGIKFRRQKPVGPYIADFLCFEYKLIVEADGGQHGSLADFDRDVWLREHGYVVLRFWNNQVHDEIEGGLEAIRLALLAQGLIEPPALTPSPSPKGRGETTNDISNPRGLLPSPARGRGAGGEGQRIKRSNA